MTSSQRTHEVLVSATPWTSSFPSVPREGGGGWRGHISSMPTKVPANLTLQQSLGISLAPSPLLSLPLPTTATKNNPSTHLSLSHS